jgi:HlyD family secretion protein
MPLSSLLRTNKKKGANELFRKEALERLSSPERLDELMQIISPKNWLSLVTFVCLVAIAVLWSIFGRLPTIVSGQGVLLRPRQVVSFQAPSAGILSELLVQVGDQVKQGDLIGRIDQAELRQQLQEEKAKLSALQAQDKAKSSIQKQQSTLQVQQIELEKSAMKLKRQETQKRLQDAKAVVSILQERVNNRKRLEELGLAAKNADELLQARQVYLENQDKIASLTTQLTQIESDLKQLDSRLRGLGLTELESSTARENEIRELQSRIALYAFQLEQNSRILSQYAGQVVEIAMNPGQRVAQGVRLGSLDTDQGEAKLVGLTYFSVRDGKKIRPGMQLQIVPDTIQRERFGGIVGTVKSVSVFPVSMEGVQSLVGSVEVAKRLTANGPQIEVFAELAEDANTVTGYQWTSSRGPAVVITPGTTTSARVVVEKRAPVTYILPSLREITGL